MQDDAKEKRAEAQHSLLFGVRRSVRYHTRRRRFFDTLARFFTIFTVVGGIGTFTTLLAKASEIWTLIYGGATAVFSTIDLVVGCAEKARLHSDLARDFIKLEQELIKVGDDLTEKQLADFTCKRLEIEQEEPTVLRILDILCHNELCSAMGYERSEHYKISWTQRFCAQFFDLNLSKFERDSAPPSPVSKT